MFTRMIAATGLVAMARPAWAKCTAVATRDTNTVKRILAEDFMGVQPSGNHYRKAEIVEGMPRAPEIFASNPINDVIVRFYENMAVTQGNESWRKKNGETGRFVWTDTGLKRNGRWQIVAAQDLIAPANVLK